MSYNMKKMDWDNWKNLKSIANYNQRKIIFHPLYNKKKFVKEIYKSQMNKDLDLSNLKTFSEKLNGFKLDKSINKMARLLADKNKVRDYVKEKVGKKYLIPHYFAKRKITVDDLKELPNSFVLKTNNGSGSNYIVTNKKEEDLQEVCNYLNYISTIKYGYIWGEFFYNKIKPCIVAEKLLVDKEGNIPDDLKCFCFKDNDGIRRKILYFERVVGDERYRIMFDEDWKILDYGSSFGKLDIDLKRPKNYKEILNIIDKLSEDFSFIRVDLFLFKDKIYFGELTFIPTAGYLKFDDDKIDDLWGSYIAD